MVEVQTKSIKKAVKFIFSIPMLLFAALLMYGDWIVLTFAVNRCASLDEFDNEPDQFQALLPGEDIKIESEELVLASSD